MIDRELQDKVFINNSKMSTPVTFLKSFWPQPHDCTAIVVNKARFHLDDLNPPIFNLTLPFNGYMRLAKFQSTLRLSIQCNNSKTLVEDCLLNGITDPVSSVCNTLLKEFQDAAYAVLSTRDLTLSDLNNDLPALSKEILQKGIEKTYKKYRWLTISEESFSLTLVNSEEILQYINEKIREKDILEKKIIEAIIQTLGKPLLTQELVEITKEYLKGLPDYNDKTIFDFFERYRSLQPAYPDWLINSVLVKFFGPDGKKKGFLHERLL